MEKLLASIPETEAALNEGRTSVYERIARGELESVKQGRKRSIVVASIHALVEKLRAEAKMEAR
jgi:hypothetical protein